MIDQQQRDDDAPRAAATAARGPGVSGPGGISFEELLALPHLQFDLDNELLPHLLAFSPAPIDTGAGDDDD